MIRKALVGSGIISGAGYVVKERHDYVNRKSIALEFLEERPKLELVDDDDDDDDQNTPDEIHIDNLLKDFREQKKLSGNVVSTVHKNFADFNHDMSQQQQVNTGTTATTTTKQK